MDVEIQGQAEIDQIAAGIAASVYQEASYCEDAAREALGSAVSENRAVFITWQATMVCTHCSDGINGALERASEEMGEATVENGAYLVLLDYATQVLDALIKDREEALGLFGADESDEWLLIEPKTSNLPTSAIRAVYDLLEPYL